MLINLWYGVLLVKEASRGNPAFDFEGIAAECPALLCCCVCTEHVPDCFPVLWPSLIFTCTSCFDVWRTGNILLAL